MKKSKIPIYNENKMRIGDLITESNIDDVMSAIYDDFKDCACMHGVDCFDYMGTCVYCGFQLSEEQMKERRNRNGRYIDKSKKGKS